MGEKRIQKKKKERKTNKQTKTNSWEQYLKSLFRKCKEIFFLYMEFLNLRHLRC